MATAAPTDNAPPDVLTGFLDLTQQFATNFEQQFQYGVPADTESTLQAERNKFNTLNGSGPVDPAAAQQAASDDATGWGVGELFGRVGNTVLFKPAGSKAGALSYIIGGAILLIGIWGLWKFIKRKL